MRRIVSIIIIPLILLLFYNQAANWHYHKLPNGFIIEHAHPYSKQQNTDSPYQKHNHNEIELLIIGLISSILGLVFLIFASGLFFMHFKTLQKQLIPSFHTSKDHFITINPLRGPPSIF